MNICKLIDEHLKVMELVKDTMCEAINKACDACKKCIEQGGTIFFMGNGGSAADSQHLAAEFVGRFVKERRAMSAVALTTDTSILTSIGNDYGFDSIFQRQIEGLAKKGDVVVGITTSGNSINIINAINMAKEIGATTIGLLGRDGGELKELCDISLVVPSDVTARVQEAHITIGHIICSYVDEHKYVE